MLGCHRNLFLVRRPVVATGTGPALMTDFATDLREIFDATMFDRLEAYEVLTEDRSNGPMGTKVQSAFSRFYWRRSTQSRHR